MTAEPGGEKWEKIDPDSWEIGRKIRVKLMQNAPGIEEIGPEIANFEGK
jgi:hypothetical protein